MRSKTTIVPALSIAALAILVGIGIWQASVNLCRFWQSFVPGVLSNVIAVTIGVVIGVPFGLAVNRHFAQLNEQRQERRTIERVTNLLEGVKLEVDVHSALLGTLGSIFGAPQDTSPKIAPSAPKGTQFLNDIVGKQFLSDGGPFEIGESAIYVEVANYYGRARDLNGILSLTRGIEQPELDAWVIQLGQSVWVSQKTVLYDVSQAIERLRVRLGNERKGD